MSILIGVAWPYASGPRHLGHLAGAYLPADVVARYHRLTGADVLVVSGSDQYGTPITVAAERAGVAPADFADAQHERIAASFQRVGIGFDLYTRTATATHTGTVQHLFKQLYERGVITEGTTTGAFCPHHNRSLPDRYVEGTCPHCAAPDARGDQCDSCGRTLDPDELVDPRCRLCESPAELRQQRQLLVDFAPVQPLLREWLGRVRRTWRPWIAEEAAGALAVGLLPRSITRDIPWGVPVPLDGWEDRRLYVWFDAVIGYLSATVEWAERHGEPDGWKRYWCSPTVRHRYFIGKDNVWFHALWWPALLLASGAGLHLPDDLVASQYLTEGGAQFSTSRGHGTTIDDAIDRIGVDPLRHALCALAPEQADTEFTWEQAGDLTRTGLLGSIANPAHRVATLLWRRAGGVVDETSWSSETVARERTAAAGALAEIGAAFDRAELRRATSLVHELGRTVNRRLAATEPWNLPDDAAARELTVLLPWLDALAVAAWPIVPTTAGNIASTLGRPATPAGWALPVGVPRITATPAPPLNESGVTTSRDRGRGRGSGSGSAA